MEGVVRRVYTYFNRQVTVKSKARLRWRKHY
jgi:hypothetical protein